MKDFPEFYNDEEIAKMYAELDLSHSQVEFLKTYIESFVNLYDIITVEKAYSIINEQNPNEFSPESFVKLTEILRHENLFYFILSDDEISEVGAESQPMQRKIIAEWLLDDLDDFDRMLFLQEGKPFYVPEKEELLKYVDCFYYKETPQTKALADFFVNEMKMTAKKANDMVCETISTMCISFGEAEVPFDDFARMGIYFTREQAEKYLYLFVDLFNNTRHTFNRGNTPAEMQKRVIPLSADVIDEQKNMARNGFTLPEKVMDSLDDLPQNIRRNALCPCGSGKKYKRCCGKI